MTGKDVSSPVKRVLSRLSSSRRSGTEWVARCPAHDDRNPSLRIAEGEDGRALLHCHGGCGTDDVLRVLGLTMADLFPGAEHRQGSRSRVSRHPRTWSTVDEAVAELCRGAMCGGLWVYENVDGSSVMAVVRINGKDGAKDYRPLRPVGTGWSLGAPKAPRPLYRLRELARSEAEVVYVVEGEKCVDSLTRIGVTAATSSGGASAWYHTDWSPLAGRDVVILPDSDGPGREYAERVAAILRNLSPPSKVSVVKLPALGEGEDVADWIESHRARGLEDVDILEQLSRMDHGVGEGHGSVNGSGPAEGPGEPGDPEERWQPPLPLPGESAPAPLPLDAFDELTRSFIEAVSVHLQVPKDSVVTMFLGVTAAALQGRFQVRCPSRNWKEPLALYLATFLESGNRKSALVALIAKPLFEWIQEEARRLQPEIRQLAEERTVLEGKLKRARDSAVRGKGSMAEVHELVDELDRLVLVVAPDFLMDDSTPEAVAMRMDAQQGRCAVLSAEGDILANMAGRYSDGDPRHQLFLKAHSGDPVWVDRVGRERIHIPSPTMTLALAVQPELLHELAKKRVLRATGLLARFLYTLPESLVGFRRSDPPPVPVELMAWHREQVRRLLNLPTVFSDGHRSLVPAVIDLSPEAEHLLLDFQDEIEVRMRPGGDLFGLKDWTSKLPGAAMRISACLSLLEARKPSTEWTELQGEQGSVHSVHALSPISGHQMRRAIMLARGFVEHAKAAFGIMGADPRVEAALATLRWIRRRGEPSFSRRDLQRANPSIFKTVDETGPPLQLLEQHGHVRSEAKEQGPRGPGRPPSDRFLVNQQILIESEGS